MEEVVMIGEEGSDVACYLGVLLEWDANHLDDDTSPVQTPVYS